MHIIILIKSRERRLKAVRIYFYPGSSDKMGVFWKDEYKSYAKKLHFWRGKV